MILRHHLKIFGLSFLLSILYRECSSQTSNAFHTHNDASSSHVDDPTRPSLFASLGDPFLSGSQSSSFADFSVAPGITLINDNAIQPSFEPLNRLEVGGTAREGHFSSNGKVELAKIFSVKVYNSLSFKTCSYGTLFEQVGDSSDLVRLSLDENGFLVFHVELSTSQTITSTIARQFNDNLWHHIYLKYELGNVYLGVDSHNELIANSTYNEKLFSANFASSQPRLVVGGSNFEGCVLEGANFALSSAETKHENVEWGVCHLPVGKSCSGYLTDPCFSGPCGKQGVCVPSGQQYTCECFTRYSGPNCQVDLGPLCQNSVETCENGGVCQEDVTGNSTFCTCPNGFMGRYCEEIARSFCTATPCAHNGTCVLSQFEDSYQCICPPGFTDQDCGVAKNFCSDNPCLHGGVCSANAKGFSCDCSGINYTGQICETDVNECAEGIEYCLNGGTCIDLYGGFECACLPGFTKNDCSEELNECVSSPCENGGICTDLSNDYACDCTTGFKGKNCEKNIDDCVDVLCGDNAQCVDEINGHSCVCMPGYTGDAENCVKIDFCASTPCLNGGTCFDGDVAHTCICPLGFTGENCETNIDDCESVYCENEGTCVDGINAYNCSCVTGFSGEFCEINVNECAQNVCVNAVDCTDLTGDYLCECEVGWSGKNCDIDIDECESGPCLNNATCTNLVGSFVCSCPAGFEGSTCEINVDDCASNPCLNGATCQDGFNNYTCMCDDTFMGRNCEKIYDACHFGPCENGATCSTTLGRRDYTCACSAGFEGENCEVNIDDCLNVQCMDGKICYDGIDSYDCKCTLGFTGPNCSVEIDECEQSPCLNGATCLDKINNYTCLCDSGYTGVNCSEDIDECKLYEPCGHGICQNTNGSFQCYCTPGYSGVNCSFDIDECLYLPCKNGATCIDKVNQYACECAPGFEGHDCEIDIDECLSNPCLNGATCVDGVANFTCECVPGFNDHFCGTNIDECEPEPCLHGGECIDEINAYSCVCADTGFNGTNCELNIDDCAQNPCVHDSNCTDLVKDYNCSCHDGFEGKNCEVDIPECASFPCLNGGSCFEFSNTTLYEFGFFENFSYENAGGFMCECVLGFTGETCEINIDECESNPCMYGTCVDQINAYMCDCDAGYEGVHCENEIDECATLAPCVHGKCTDKVADYTCDCESAYGGKNCSILLIGCSQVYCENDAQCRPFLVKESIERIEGLIIDDSIHDFECECLPGYTSRYCEKSTIFSMDGDGHVVLESNAMEGYDLELNFRTTLPSVVLAVGQSEYHYFTLVLKDGRIKLHASFLNRYNGTYSGMNLNDGEWHGVRMRVNETHCSLEANGDQVVRTISLFIPTVSFTSTFLGGVRSDLRILVREPMLTGCIRDVVLHQNLIIPRQLDDFNKVNTVEECHRVPQCAPNPCNNDGTCSDLWSSFKCQCPRPYLGDTCKMSFPAATFNNERTTDSKAVVTIPLEDQAKFRRNVDISMLIRTTKPNGFVFYIGTPFESFNSLSDSSYSYILCELVGGKIMIKTQLENYEEIFQSDSLEIADGNLHLLQVERKDDTIYVRVDRKTVLTATITNSGDLDAQILYLGGIPVKNDVNRNKRSGTEKRSGRKVAKNRVKRQLGTTNVELDIEKEFFKGVIQDVRISSGNETRYVELFPLNVVEGETFELPGTPLIPDSMVNILNGTVSDDTCASQPCLQNGTCTVTFNDFTCSCPTGYKGKTCDELEYCAMFSCPNDATCRNVIGGFECVDDVTFNGRNSHMKYKSSLSNVTSLELFNFSTSYKSMVGGVLLSIFTYENSLIVYLMDNSLNIIQFKKEQSNSLVFEHPNLLDGDWHDFSIVFNRSRIEIVFDNSTMENGTDAAVGISDFVFYEAVSQGEIILGSLSKELIRILDLVIGNQSSLPNEYFRGCMREARIGGILLPVYSDEELINNTSPNKFVTLANTGVNTGCEVCFQNECQNGGMCEDPSNVFTCSCAPGFEGELCEINIDECSENQCKNNAVCIDRINAYECQCQPGYEGQFCESEIDECLSSPCLNGGVCLDVLNNFVCECTEEYTGFNCAEYKINNCSKLQCSNDGICRDIFNEKTGFAEDFSCECKFGYDGRRCENEIDFCERENVVCEHGVCLLTHENKGWKCMCEEGYEGEFCHVETNECHENPCKNGGNCTDLHRSFECRCTEGWKGRTCEENRDECAEIPDLCKNGSTCIDTEGGFECECTIEFCGKTCSLLNPCLEQSVNCTHGNCEKNCDEETHFTEPICRCFDGWQGLRCEEVASLSTQSLSIIVGAVVTLMLLFAVVGFSIFIMMAKKKRETSGTYSPSKQEFYSPRVELGHMMKPPPEERLI